LGFEQVLEGSIHLIPAEGRLEDLRRGYDDLDVIFFGDRPRFEVLLKSLITLED
jgi:hypothetical protein